MGGRKRLSLRALLATLCISIAHAAPTISAGTTHGLAARTDGSVLAWGEDVRGELGQGGLVQSSTPRALSGLSDVTAVAAGDRFALALTRSGRVFSWGRNVYGQLGDGTRESHADPRAIPGLDDVVAIAASGDVGFAVKRDGTAWCWGLSVDVLFTRSFTENNTVPGRMPGLSDIRAIWAGRSLALALRGDGTLWAWGSPVGDGTSQLRGSPIQVPGLAGVIGAAVGADDHALVLLSDGTVRAWGANDEGQLGDGTQVDRLSPVAVPGLSGVRSVAAAFSTSAAVRTDGTVLTWGNNAFSMLGIGPTTPFVSRRLVPDVVPGLTGAAEVSGGTFNFLARRQSGDAVGWGDNAQGQLGEGTTLGQDRPTAVASLAQAASIVAGDEVSYAVLSDGTVRGWGSNSSGLLAVARTERFSTPQVVHGIDGVTAVAAGYQYSIALRSDGTVWGWGANDASQLGDGTTTPRALPVQSVGVANATAICAALNISAALRSDGSVWIWGYARQGLDSSYFSEAGRRAIVLPGLTDVTAISCGNSHLLALRRDGSVWAAGYNQAGQLGRGTESLFEGTPAPVLGVSGVVAIAGSYQRSFAVTSDGSLYAWGSGESFLGDVPMLGDGTHANRSTAARVPGVNDAVAVASARHDSHTLVLRRDGTLLGFGQNGGGQLGDGSTEDRGTPVAVQRITSAAEIEAGGAGAATGSGFSYVRLPAGGVLAWGDNYDGELADGTFSRRVLPVAAAGAQGDSVLDLSPTTPSGIAAAFLPVFGVVATAGSSPEVPSINAQVTYRASDVGSTGNVYVFALAPATIVRGAATLKASQPGIRARGAPKDAPVACALAQLNAQGQLVAVSAASLQAYVSGVLSAQGQAVTILNNVPATSVAGATFYVGYGPSGNAMLVNGTTRSAVSVPASVSCAPQPPQTGWWYNAAEPGRGFSIEAQGNHLFFAAFHYDASGRATWNFAGGATSLDGSLFTSDFQSASNGQTLTGGYRLPGLATAGSVTFAFSDATHGTMTWPGGVVAIERQPFVPNGLTAAPPANQPESGWWWNPTESGRGFFIEWQGGVADLAGYMYDDAGNPTWYISAYATPNARLFEGNWWTFAGGQSMGGPFKPATRTSDNVGSVRIDFTGTTTATMTLPDGRRIALERQRF